MAYAGFLEWPCWPFYSAGRGRGPLVEWKVLLLLGAGVNVRVLDLPRLPAVLLGVGASVHWLVWMGRGLDGWVVAA